MMEKINNGMELISVIGVNIFDTYRILLDLKQGQKGKIVSNIKKIEEAKHNPCWSYVGTFHQAGIMKTTEYTEDENRSYIKCNYSLINANRLLEYFRSNLHYLESDTKPEKKLCLA